jgi:putative transcriptional regulator
MKNSYINNKIRTLRFFANEMTQQELADETGVTRQTIVAIENGKYFPTLELSFRIAHVFGQPIEEVFTYSAGDDPVLAKIRSKSKKKS